MAKSREQLEQEHAELNTAKNKAIQAKLKAEEAAERDPSAANKKALTEAVAAWEKEQSAFAKVDKELKALNEAEENARAGKVAA